MSLKIKNLIEEQQLPFKIEDLKALEEVQEDVRIRTLCKKLRLALHIIADITKNIKEKTPEA